MGTSHTFHGLSGKRILLGVTGSIAAYKAPAWVRFLIEDEALVTVVMTDSAKRFVTPLTFSALTGNTVYSDMFDDESSRVMSHINLAREADVILVAPATADTIARLASGMANDLLSTAVLAADCPVLVCPAMNSKMFTHRATQDNIRRLQSLGYHMVAPESGSLACGEEGPGRLVEWDVAKEKLLKVLSRQDLSGQKVLVTAGPTREPLDPARYISNRSSGKMGYALARVASRRGADVTLITGPVSLSPPPGIDVITVSSAAEMYDAVMEIKNDFSIIVKAAAVADFRPVSCREQKIKKSGGIEPLQLLANTDILLELGENKPSDQFIVGFAAESCNHLEEGFRKLQAKNVDLMVVNDILGKNTGFDVDTNQVTLIDRNENVSIPLLSKEQTADKIYDRVIQLNTNL